MTISTDSLFDAIVDSLANPGYFIADDFLEPRLWKALAEEARSLAASGKMKAAAIGAGSERAVHQSIRGDRIVWLCPSQASAASRALLERLEALQAHLNRFLFMGLRELECHFAAYAPGAGYQKHLDQFRGNDTRQLTIVLYLNDDWRDSDGGLLRLYLDDNGKTLDVAPYGGRLVCFRSALFPHEVLPSARTRYSLAGWFRRAAALGV